MNKFKYRVYRFHLIECGQCLIACPAVLPIQYSSTAGSLFCSQTLRSSDLKADLPRDSRASEFFYGPEEPKSKNAKTK